LDQKPAYHRGRDGTFVNVAAFQFGKEVPLIHVAAAILAKCGAKQNGVCKYRGQIAEAGGPLNPSFARYQTKYSRNEHRQDGQILLQECGPGHSALPCTRKESSEKRSSSRWKHKIKSKSASRGMT
jgi:hypothetical protein